MAYPYNVAPPPPPYSAVEGITGQLQMSQLTTGGAAKEYLVSGAVVHLWSRARGRSVRIDDQGNVTALGGAGQFAQYTVHTAPSQQPGGGGVVSLQNKKNPQYWLGIYQGAIIGNGHGGEYCQFRVIDHGYGLISLESVRYSGQHISFNNSGNVKLPATGNLTDGEKFCVIPAMSPNIKGQFTPRSTYLVEGAWVYLWAKSSGTSLVIQEDGVVSANGFSGPYAQFIVHIRGEGIVALQNVKHRDHWIAIKDGRTVGTGKGGKFTNLRIFDADYGFTCFESVEHKAQNLGTLGDQSVKPPSQTGRGNNGQFFVIVNTMGSNASGAPVESKPPPMQGGYPIAQGGYPQPPQGGYPQPPQGGYPMPQPLQGEYPQLPQPQGGFPIIPQPPTVPVGFNVMDSFYPGNHLQLIVRSNGYPIHIADNGDLKGLGDFSSSCDFKVHLIPSQQVPPVTMVKLQSVVHPSQYLAIHGGRVVGKGKGGVHCQFIVGALSDDYITLQSASQPQCHVNMTSQGTGGSAHPSSPDAQFFVRLSKQCHYSQAPVMTSQFGRPSVISHLRHETMVQLESYRTGVLLGVLAANGTIGVSHNTMDPNTVFVVIDRGMGILSFKSLLFPAYWLCMTQQQVVQVQGIPDLKSDFRFLDNADGSVSLAAVQAATSHVVINSNTHLSISSVTMAPSGNAIQTRSPLN